MITPSDFGLHLEHFPERTEVFNDAIVNDRDGVRAVGVRVRVGLVRLPVRGPARVRDADRSVNGVQVHDVLEHRDLAFGLARLEAVTVAHCDSCRVVAAILEAFEAFDQKAARLAFTYVANDSAHMNP